MVITNGRVKMLVVNVNTYGKMKILVVDDQYLM